MRMDGMWTRTNRCGLSRCRHSSKTMRKDMARKERNAIGIFDQNVSKLNELPERSESGQLSVYVRI